jgi:hypothetical protein
MRKIFALIIIFLFLLIVINQIPCSAEKPPYKFNQEIKINTDDYWENEQWGPSLAVYENIVYITWWDIQNDTEAVYIAKSIDGGENFTEGKKIDNIPHSLNIVIGSTGIIYAVFYYSGNISFTKSTDGGESFTTPVKVNDEQGDGFCYLPEIAVDLNDNIYVVWDDNRNHLPLDKSSNSDIYFAMSTDKGNSFGENIRVNDDISISNQIGPNIAVSKLGDVFVVWTDERNDDDGTSGVDWDIYLAKYNEIDNSFEKNIKVFHDSTHKAQGGPNIAIDNSDNIFITCSDNREGPGDENGTYKIYLSKSTISSLIFGPDTFVASGTGGLIAADDNGIYITTRSQFVYSKDGESFSEPMSVTTFFNSPGAIILDNQSNIYVVWMDWRSGMGDIYFKKGIRTDPSSENGNNDINGNSIDNGLGNWLWVIGIFILIVIIVVFVTRRRSNIHK